MKRARISQPVLDRSVARRRLTGSGMGLIRVTGFTWRLFKERTLTLGLLLVSCNLCFNVAGLVGFVRALVRHHLGRSR